MKLDTQYNEFLSLIYDLYDNVMFPEKGNIIVTERKVGWFKKETIERNARLDSIKEKIELFKRCLITETPDFNRLWDFCEFIRISEKIFFYPNEPDNRLYVEMNMNERGSGVRKFKYVNLNRVGNTTRSELRFTLEHNVLGHDILSISVVRDYGLKMNNTYKIVDGEMQYPDSSDLYLINEINFNLKLCMHSAFSFIVDLVLNGGHLS